MSSLIENLVKTNMCLGLYQILYCSHNLMCHCLKLCHVYNNNYNNTHLFVILVSQLFTILLMTFLQALTIVRRSRRALVGSVLAYQTKSQGSSSRSDIKTKYEKYFCGDFLSAKFLVKTLRSKSNCHENFLKKSVVRSRLLTVGPAIYV